MCADGTNADEVKANLEQIEEAVALSRRWVHRAFHKMEDAGKLRTAAKLRDAQSLLDDVRALLEEAMEAIEKESAADDVTVRLV